MIVTAWHEGFITLFHMPSAIYLISAGASIHKCEHTAILRCYHECLSRCHTNVLMALTKGIHIQKNSTVIKCNVTVCLKCSRWGVWSMQRACHLFRWHRVGQAGETSGNCHLCQQPPLSHSASSNKPLLVTCHLRHKDTLFLSLSRSLSLILCDLSPAPPQIFYLSLSLSDSMCDSSVISTTVIVFYFSARLPSRSFTHSHRLVYFKASLIQWHTHTHTNTQRKRSTQINKQWQIHLHTLLPHPHMYNQKQNKNQTYTAKHNQGNEQKQTWAANRSHTRCHHRLLATHKHKETLIGLYCSQDSIRIISCS